MELTVSYILSQIFIIINYLFLAISYYSKNRKTVLCLGFISLIANSNNKEAQLFYEKLGYKKEVGYVKVINKI